MRALARTVVAGVLLLPALLVEAPGRAESVVAVNAGRILTMAGAPIERGTIIIREGKIARLGSELKVPEQATVVDANQSVVMPGLVDANARFALAGDANEESDEITPTFSVRTALDRDSTALKRALQLGTTTLRLVPGNRNVIGGTGVVIKATGGRPAEMVVREDGNLKVVVGDEPAYGNSEPAWERPTSFYYRQPTTRMGVIWLLRQALFNVQQALQSGAQLSSSQQALAEALQGQVPVEVTVRSAVDIETVFEVADEFGLRRLVLVECTEGYKLAPEIARRDIPVILGPSYYYPADWTQSNEGWDVSWNNAGLLARAGVKVALASNNPEGPTDLRQSAMLAVRHGLPAEEALKAITANAAEVIGVADRVGSLTKGKDADLLILSGDPLQATTRVQSVIVNGRVVSQAQSGASASG